MSNKILSNVAQQNLLNDNEIRNSKFIKSSEVIQSKIRKFYFLIDEKEIERDLRVTMSIITGEKLGEENILLELTNDLNPVFLFILCITQTDFETLRNSQGLNVKFKDFPNALLNLLDLCINNDTNNKGRYKLMLTDYCGTATGGCVMDMSKIQIQILELCAFRNICHLTLDIMRGTEIQIRQKLEMEICKVKQELLKTSELLDEELMKTTKMVEELNVRNSKIDDLNITLEKIKDSAENECERVRVNTETLIKQLQEEYEVKLLKENEQFQVQVNIMQSKIDNLEMELKNIYEREVEMKSVIHEKEREKELCEVELISKKQEIYQLRTQNEKLDSDYHDKEKTVNILRTRVAVAEQEVKANKDQLSDLQNKFDHSLQEKATIQKSLESFKKKWEKKEAIVLTLSEELVKANDIISKQQTRLSILSSKLSERDEAVSRQEKLLHEKEENFSKQNEMIGQLQKAIDMSTDKMIELSKKINHLEKKNEDANDRIKFKSRTIAKLKDNMKDYSPHSDICKSSLLFYRTFLSMPSLLPSDEIRRTDQIWDSLLSDHVNLDESFGHKKIANTTAHAIRPYLYRYIRRFQSVPLSLFKSNVPLPVLLSPDGANPVNKLYDSVIKNQTYVNEDIQCTGDCKVSHKLVKVYPSTTLSDTSFRRPDNSKDLQLFKSHSSENNIDKPIGTGLIIDNSKNQLQDYSSAFSIETANKSSSQSCVQRNYLSLEPKISTPSVRTRPAVGAPPLTAEQRKVQEKFIKKNMKQLHTGSIIRGNQVRVGKLKFEQLHIPESITEIRSNESNMQSPKHINPISAIKNYFNPSSTNKNLNESVEPSAYFII